MQEFLTTLQPYLESFLSYVNFAWDHILSAIMATFAVDAFIAKIIVIVGLLYLFLLYILGKVHKKQEKKSLKRLEAYSLKVDDLLAQVQMNSYKAFQETGTGLDCSWINDLLAKKTYFGQENMLAPWIQATDLALLKTLKKQYNWSKMRANIRGWFIVLGTFGLYKIIWRD